MNEGTGAEMATGFAFGPGGCVSSSGTAFTRGSVGAPRGGTPDRQISPDAELTRSFALGCAVLFLAFLLLTALVYYFWSR